MRCPNDMELSKYIVSKNNSEDIEKHLLECDICFDTVNILQKKSIIKSANNLNFNSNIKGIMTLASSLMILAIVSFVSPNAGNH